MREVWRAADLGLGQPEAPPPSPGRKDRPVAKTPSNPEVISREAIDAVLAGTKPARTWNPDTPKHGGNHVLLGEAVQYAIDPMGWRERRLRWYAAQTRAGLYGAEAAGGYRGYWLEGWLFDLRTARIAGHEDIAAAALGAIRARIAIETLCETSAGRAIVPGARTGDPWRGKTNDTLRNALRDGRPLPTSSDRRWRLKAALGWRILRDVLSRGHLPELPLGNGERWLPRLRWDMAVHLHANGFFAEIPFFSGRIEGAPWFSVAVLGDEVVDSVSWRDDPMYEGASHNRIFHSGHVDARAPRPPLVPDGLGGLLRTVRLGPGQAGPPPSPPQPPPRPPGGSGEPWQHRRLAIDDGEIILRVRPAGAEVEFLRRHR
jgi:hypothetical protein